MPRTVAAELEVFPDTGKKHNETCTQAVFAVRKQSMAICIQLAFSFFFSLGPKSTKWCHMPVNSSICSTNLN